MNDNRKNQGMQEIIKAIEFQGENDKQDLQLPEMQFLVELYDKDLMQLCYIAYSIGFKRGFEQGEDA